MLNYDNIEFSYNPELGTVSMISGNGRASVIEYNGESKTLFQEAVLTDGYPANSIEVNAARAYLTAMLALLPEEA